MEGSTVMVGISEPGFPIEHVPDLSSVSDRKRLSPSAMQGFMAIIEKWGLNETYACPLLGGITASTYHAWKCNQEGLTLSQDTLTRISLLIGIYKALHVYLGDPWADQWMSRENDGFLFSGKKPIDHLINKGIQGFIEVRRMLDSLCQGN
jgi:uncharacterized protein (DUF2384 family)